MADLFAELPAAQVDLLRVIAGPVLEHGRWPTWQYVEAMLERAGLEAEPLLRAMPVAGVLDGVSPNYSAVWYDHRNLGPGSEVRLTIAAGLHLPEYRPVADRMIEAIRELASRARNGKVDPFKVQNVTITSQDLASSVPPRFTEAFISAFPELLRCEPFELSGTTSVAAGRWTMEIDRRLRRYEEIRSLEQYVRTVVDRIEGDAEQARPAPEPVAVSGDRRPVEAHEEARVVGMHAHMLTVLIASPSDTREERDAVERVVMEINASRMHAERRGLLPLRWERDGVLGLHGTAQEVLNPITDKADIVVALFRGRIGTQTPEHESGTVEEIERAKRRGVPVHVFFLDYNLQRGQLDPAQFARLESWRKRLEGLYDEIGSVQDLERRVRHCLEADLHELGARQSDVVMAPPHQVTWNASMSKVNGATYELRLVPRGAVAVDEVRARVVQDGDVTPGSFAVPVFHTGDRDHLHARRLPPGQPLVGRAMVAAGTSRSFDLEVKWVEASRECGEVLTISF